MVVRPGRSGQSCPLLGARTTPLGIDSYLTYRLLGQTGLRVSELFLGAMMFGDRGGAGAPPDECRRILNLYADAGGNVVDTANFYSGGQSENILGELLEGRRDRFVVATKYTVTRDGTARLTPRAEAGVLAAPRGRSPRPGSGR